ncbi:MAG: RagB/SusD family nutrient uptake outer membrane protein [Bacteroidales bacterium]|nr:RagB/SusD family nutrient uptake outer membrane protein [Bacteroidales bacterium]
MKKLLIIVFSFICCASCTDNFLDKEPTNYASEESLMSTAQGVTSALIGCYNDFQSYTYYGRNFVLIGDVYADNAKLSSQNTGNFSAFYNYAVTADDADLKSFWSTAYRIIKNANNIIKACNDPNRNDLDEIIYGEALAIRSLAYFDLVRIFGNKSSFDNAGIPVANDTVPCPQRTSVKNIYSMIIKDLKEAESLLENAEVTPFRFNKYSVEALLVVVYKSGGYYTNARNLGEQLVASGQYSLLTADNYIESWSQESSSESIFSVAMSSTDNAGTNSIGHMLSPDGYGGLIPTDDLLKLYSDSDIRTRFFNTRSETFFNKYPGRDGLGVDNVPVLRLSEIYFILADCYMYEIVKPGATAESQKENYDKLIAVMDALTKRVDPTAVFDNLSMDDLLLKIHEEYRKEFAFEGKRFFQIKRSIYSFAISREDCNSNICTVENPSYMFAFPIPTAELNANPNLTQNQGY